MTPPLAVIDSSVFLLRNSNRLQHARGVCVCLSGRGKECVCVCVGERKSLCVCVCYSGRGKESECVSARAGEG